MANSVVAGSNSASSSSFQIVGKLGEGNIVKRIQKKEVRKIESVYIEKDILCEGSAMGIDGFFRHFDPSEFDIIYGKGNWRTFTRTSWERGVRFLQVVLEVRR